MWVGFGCMKEEGKERREGRKEARERKEEDVTREKKLDEDGKYVVLNVTA